MESYARNTYKGIGSKLVQIAVEKSLEHGAMKDVKLNAQRLHSLQFSPEGFYLKLGFLKTHEQGFSETATYGVEMVLHPIQYKMWTDRIKNSPIFNSSFS